MRRRLSQGWGVEAAGKSRNGTFDRKPAAGLSGRPLLVTDCSVQAHRMYFKRVACDPMSVLRSKAFFKAAL